MKRVRQSKSLDKFFWLAVVLLAFLFLLRLIFLDATPPKNSILDYSPVDEGIYANLALNKINFGTINPNNYFSENITEMNAQTPINLIGNVAVYLGLITLGDNYYGFRVPIVVTSAVIFLLILLCFYLVSKRYPSSDRKKWIGLIIMALIITNFVFYNASRMVEPTIFRMLFVALVLFVFLALENHNRIRSYLSGLLTVISMFLVYINNSFLCVGIVLFLIYLLLHKETKKALECLLFGVLGIGTACIVAQIYYHYWGTTFIENMLSVIGSFQGNSNYSFTSNTSFLWTIMVRIKSFFTSNFFIYCMPFLVGVILSFKQIVRMLRRKNDTVAFCFFQIVALFLQTMVSEDFINRKSIVLLPFMAVLLYEVIVNAVVQHEFASSKLLAILSIITVILCVYCKIYHGGIGYGDHNQNDLIIFLVFFTIPSILISVCFLFKKLKCPRLLLVCIAFVCLGNGLFVFRYNIKNVNFAEKDAMIALQEFDDEYIMGEYENGFTLYNSFKPVLDTRENLYELMKNGRFEYYFDYNDVDAFLANEFPNVLFERVHIVKREFPNQFGNNDMCVYRVTYLGE